MKKNIPKPVSWEKIRENPEYKGKWIVYTTLSDEKVQVLCAGSLEDSLKRGREFLQDETYEGIGYRFIRPERTEPINICLGVGQIGNQYEEKL